jgi:hypothetical protein
MVVSLTLSCASTVFSRFSDFLPSPKPNHQALVVECHEPLTQVNWSASCIWLISTTMFTPHYSIDNTGMFLRYLTSTTIPRTFWPFIFFPRKKTWRWCFGIVNWIEETYMYSMVSFINSHKLQKKTINVKLQPACNTFLFFPSGYIICIIPFLHKPR